MSTTPTYKFNPKLDLLLERIIEAPPELLWKAWTQPEHLSQWFVPRPWTIPQCEIDVRPGGKVHVEHERTRW